MRGIAVSALVRPSRYLMIIAAGMGVALFAAAYLLAHDGGTKLHHLLAAVCVVAGATVSLFPLARKKCLRIDVSGIGQIRLVDTYSNAEAGSTERSVSDSEVVQLLRGSTFWSSLMVLRLQRRSGHTIALLIFPDSVGADAFHALSVAFLWLAARHASPEAQSGDFSLTAD